jgi:hypothetical protein
MRLSSVLYEHPIEQRDLVAIPVAKPAAPPKLKRSQPPRAVWWTRERVIVGLLRFQREQGFVATSTEAYHTIAKSEIKGSRRHYPPACAVLRYWRTFREAWTAAGVDADRNHEDYRPEEEWFIREAAGILTREEIAVELKRTPLAIKTWLRWHGLNTRDIRGWTINRTERVCQIPAQVINRYLDRGEIPYLRGTQCTYFDPADLLVVEEIDWQDPPAELEQAVRRSLIERLVRILQGEDWTFGRPYQYQPVRTTDKRWRPCMFKAPPCPAGISVGDRVRCIEPDSERPEMEGREGTVLLVYYRRNTNSTRADTLPQWMARVEFPKTRRLKTDKQKVVYSLPLGILEREAAS